MNYIYADACEKLLVLFIPLCHPASLVKQGCKRTIRLEGEIIMIEMYNVVDSLVIICSDTIDCSLISESGVLLSGNLPKATFGFYLRLPL